MLTDGECAALINVTERSSTFTPERIYFGYGYRADDPAVSSRDVVRFWDDALAATLLERLSRLLPVLTASNTTGRQQGEVWRLAGLNAGFRIARYAAGDQLPTHTDHVTHAGSECVSAWTLTVYLNSIHPMQGGSTDFSLSHMTGAMNIPTLQPRAGSGLLLAHDVLHSGAKLHAGQKWILRTEPLYWSGAPAGAGLGSLGDFASRWPDVDDTERSRPEACPLERVLASERECRTCS